MRLLSETYEEVVDTQTGNNNSSMNSIINAVDHVINEFRNKLDHLDEEEMKSAYKMLSITANRAASQ